MTDYETAYRALREGLEALAETWPMVARALGPRATVTPAECYDDAAADLRALLASSPAEREGEGHVWWDADHDRKADAYTPPERAYCRQCGVGRSFAVDLCHVAVSRGIREPAPAPVSSGEAGYRERQRQRDNLPCPSCGGDRLRPTFRDPNACHVARPAPVVTPSTEVEPCPECQQGKHPNCDGTTWNTITDSPDQCPCALAGHGEDQQ